MTRAVLDVNVLVSGFPAAGGVPAALIERWLRREFELVLSEHILGGIARAWTNPYYRARYRADEAQRALALLRARATVVTPMTSVHDVGNDEEDDLVLATAVAGQVPYLVTGDKGLLALNSYQGITILAPRVFLDLVAQQEDGAERFLGPAEA